MLVPELLVESAVSALHIRLLEILPEQERSRYGNIIGETFEKFIANLVTRAWPAASVAARVQKRGWVGDADLLVRLSGGSEIHVQCKGKMLKPAGRWGRVETFRQSIHANVLEAARQARMAITDPKDPTTIAVLIVLEAAYPSLTTHIHQVPDLHAALTDLPHPIVLSHYDLSYLVRKVNENEFGEYIRWRERFLNCGLYRVTDEFDVTRAFLERDELEIRPRRSGEFPGTYVGSDEDYHRLTMSEAIGDLTTQAKW